MKKYFNLIFIAIATTTFAIQTPVYSRGQSNQDNAESVLIITDYTSDKVIAKKGVVIVDFYADWCPPCKILAPIYAQAANQMGDKALFAKANVSDSKLTFDKLNVKAMPTLILFKDGKEVKRRTGACDIKTLIKFVESAL